MAIDALIVLAVFALFGVFWWWLDRQLVRRHVEWHDTPQLWVAYRGCGCADCPKGFGKTQEEAVADLDVRDATKRISKEQG